MYLEEGTFYLARNEVWWQRSIENVSDVPVVAASFVLGLCAFI